MPYIINNTRGNLVATVADGTVDISTIPVALVGRGLTPYGLYENENYVYLLENFCNPTAPVNPMQGQLWFDSANTLLSVFSVANAWVALASQSYVQEQKISPIFTGVPSAPTAVSGTNTTQLATTAFVHSAVTGNISCVNLVTQNNGNITADLTVGGNLNVNGATNLNSLTVSGAASLASLSVSGNITAASITIPPGGTLGNITVQNILNANGNGTGNIGNASVYFNTVFAKSTSAQYADLAEHYQGDGEYPAGTVVVFGGSAEITVSDWDHDPRVAGVVSANPAYVMNAQHAHTLVALQGRVMCRVQGPVSKGDRLVNVRPGVAGRLRSDQYQPGCVIGKSLVDVLTADEVCVEVAVGRL